MISWRLVGRDMILSESTTERYMSDGTIRRAIKREAEIVTADLGPVRVLDYSGILILEDTSGDRCETCGIKSGCSHDNEA